MTELGITPSQTAGPYLRIGLLRNILTPNVVDPADPRAIRIRGRLTDGAGDGVPDGMVETWQANAAGRYRDQADDRAEPPLEDGFLGFGRSGTEDDGRFEIVTVKPGRVPWPEGGLQAPHIEVVVFARGLLKHAVTRLYFPDEADANAGDPVLARLRPEQRDTVVAVAEDGGLRFDIRLQGPAHTTFFAV
jgi:protocatechuate 3,4-dioxygenase alpha subunit